MRKQYFYKAHITVVILMMIISLACTAQIRKHAKVKETVTLTIDSSFMRNFQFDNPSVIYSLYSGFNYIYHSPRKSDNRRVKRYASLINQQPTEGNHILYSNLARSLWNLKRTKEAEKMFQNILDSKENFYTATYYNSSDIPGDTTTNIYGYGSYTSSYKNEAALYLTKICIEQKRFEEALHYMDLAAKTYPVSYSCGTGAMSQQNEYDFLYASCYEGLNKNKELLDLTIPACINSDYNFTIDALKKLYSKKEIEDSLRAALNSVHCEFNDFPSYEYLTTYNGKKIEKTDTITYFSGTATMMLFGRIVDIPSPELKNNEHITKEHFLTVFKTSTFYNTAKKEDYEENKPSS